MFESIINFFKKLGKTENKESKEKTAGGSKDKAKERLHLVLMQDRANVSADFLELMKQEIIDVIKKYIEVDEKEIDVRLTNEVKEDGTTGAPSLYANIPIVNIRNEMKKDVIAEKKEDKQENNKSEKNVGENIAHPKEEKNEDKQAEEKVEEKKEEKEEIKEEENKEKEENEKESAKAKTAAEENN